MGQAPSGGAKSMGAGEAGHQRPHRRGREEDAQALGARASRSSQIRLDPEAVVESVREVRHAHDQSELDHLVFAEVSLELVERPVAEPGTRGRSEEHTSELQSQSNLVCRLLLEKK